MAGKDKTPPIRFAGFSNAWGTCKLSEISDKVKDKNSTLQFTETFTNSAEFGIISQRDFFDHEKSNIENLDGYYVVKNEDFVYNPRISKSAPVGPINRNKLGRTGVMSPLYTVFRTHDIDNTFLEQYFKSRFWHSFMKLNGDSGARSDRFSIKDSVFIEMPIPYPDLEEQLKVGEYLTNLDNLITLHHRKYDKLANVKKSMLEKMFPKDGADVPEIRFAGFTDVWEQRELGEVLTERKILQKISDDAPILAFAAGQGVIDRSERKSNNRDFLTLDPTNKIYLLTEYNDIVYNPSNLKYGAIDRNKHGKGVISPIYVTFTTEEEPSFIELIVKSEKFKLRALQFEEGTVVKRQSVKPENLLIIDVKISPSRDEQKKIGEFFEHLDNLINLHQCELEKLKNNKKALLKKMFV